MEMVHLKMSLLLIIALSTFQGSYSSEVETSDKPNNRQRFLPALKQPINRKNGNYLPKQMSNFQESHFESHHVPNILPSDSNLMNKNPLKYDRFTRRSEHFLNRYHQSPLTANIVGRTLNHSPNIHSHRFANTKFGNPDAFNKEASDKPNNRQRFLPALKQPINRKNGKYFPKQMSNFQESHFKSHHVPNILPLEYDRFTRQNEHFLNRYHQSPLPANIVGRTLNHSPNIHSHRFADTKFGNPDAFNKEVKLFQEDKKKAKELQRFKYLLNELTKRNEFKKYVSSRKLTPPKTSPQSIERYVGEGNLKRKHYRHHSEIFNYKPHSVGHRSEKENRLTTGLPKQLADFVFNFPVTSTPYSDYWPEVKWKIPSDLNENKSSSAFNIMIHNISTDSDDESRTIDHFRKQQTPKTIQAMFQMMSSRTSDNGERNSNAVELNISKSNGSDVHDEIFRDLVQLLPARFNTKKKGNLKLVILPPNNSNTTFIQDFMNELKKIMIVLIPDATVSAQSIAFKSNNGTLLIFQISLRIKHSNERQNKIFPKLYLSTQLVEGSNFSGMNENNSQLIDRAGNQTEEITKINQIPITSNYREVLRKILFELLENSMVIHRKNGSSLLISINFSSHDSYELGANLSKTNVSALCELLKENNTYVPGTEIQILIRNKDIIEDLKLLNLRNDYDNQYKRIFQKIPQLLHELSKCRNIENVTHNFNLTWIFSQHVSGHSITHILRATRNILREFISLHRIFHQLQKASIRNSLVLELNINLKPEKLSSTDKIEEKLISLNLEKPGSHLIQKLHEVLPTIIKDMKENAKPTSIIFNIYFSLGVNKNKILSETCLLIQLLDEALHIQYSPIANIILQVTLVPTNLMKNDATMHNVKFIKYKDLQGIPKEPYISLKHNPLIQKPRQVQKEKEMWPKTMEKLEKINYETPQRQRLLPVITTPKTFSEKAATKDQLAFHKFNSKFIPTSQVYAPIGKKPSFMEYILRKKQEFPSSSTIPPRYRISKLLTLPTQKSKEAMAGPLKLFYELLKNKYKKLSRFNYSSTKPIPKSIHRHIAKKQTIELKKNHTMIFEPATSSISPSISVNTFKKMNEISSTPAIYETFMTKSIQSLRNIYPVVSNSQLIPNLSFTNEPNITADNVQKKNSDYYKNRIKLHSKQRGIKSPISMISKVLHMNNNTNSPKEIQNSISTTPYSEVGTIAPKQKSKVSKASAVNKIYTLFESTTSTSGYSNNTKKNTKMETSVSQISPLKLQSNLHESPKQQGTTESLIGKSRTNESHSEFPLYSTTTESETNESGEILKLNTPSYKNTDLPITSTFVYDDENEGVTESAIFPELIEPEISGTKYHLPLYPTSKKRRKNIYMKQKSPSSVSEIVQKKRKHKNRVKPKFIKQRNNLSETNGRQGEKTRFISHEMKPWNAIEHPAEKINRVKNETPSPSQYENNLFANERSSKNSIDETSTSKFSNDETIDKESFEQYNRNNKKFSFHKRTLNLSRLDYNITNKIEKFILSELQKVPLKDNEPTVLIFKIIPPVGMMESQLTNLTQSLLPLLVADLPMSKINIETKAYGNGNNEIKFIKLKITVSNASDERKVFENFELHQNAIVIKYLDIIIQNILHQIEKSSSGQPKLNFNFTINSSGEIGKNFESNKTEFSEMILSQLLPYENVDIGANYTEDNSTITSILVNVIISPPSNLERVTRTPPNLDNLSTTELKKFLVTHFNKRNTNSSKENERILPLETVSDLILGDK